MGRPEKWDEKYLKVAEVACKLGATDVELADMFGVSLRTINYWRANRPEFAAVLRVGKEVADARVERSLFARATGYEHDEVDIRVVNGEIVETKVRKFYPPDPTSMIFWLKNRDPAKWRETKAVELTGSGGGPVRIVATPHDEAL